MKYGIIGAMQEEVNDLRTKIAVSATKSFGRHEYISGTLAGRDLVLTCSGIGKVSAGSAAAKKGAAAAAAFSVSRLSSRVLCSSR